MKKNKLANFWVRLISRIIDFSLFVTLSVTIAWFCLDKNPTQFNEAYKFYLWSISSLVILFVIFIIVPLLTKGKTIGMFLTRIKIKFSSKNIFLDLLKREAIFSLLWMSSLIVIITIINHTLINKFARTDQSGVTYTTLENFRRSIFISIFSISIILQFICIVSLIVKKNHMGLHDEFSKTRTVWDNKFITIKKEIKRTSFKPHLVKEEKIIWVEE